MAKTVFDIKMENLNYGKFEFKIILDRGSYILRDCFFIGVKEFSYNILIFGGDLNTKHKYLQYNNNKNLTSTDTIIEVNSNFIGSKGSTIRVDIPTEIKVVLYVNEKITILEDIIPSLILIFRSY